MTESSSGNSVPDFSLVLGGPLYQLFRRAHLAEGTPANLRRRIVLIALIAWLPLLLLSALSGQALGDRAAIPFLFDIEAHIRFLVALPILIAAEGQVHKRLLPAVSQFIERRIVRTEDIPKFHQAIQSTLRLRNSVSVEIALLLLVYTLGLWVWRYHIALSMATWYATTAGAGGHLTLAGYWFVFVSVPMLQFVLLRWYYRIFLWFSLLWRISKLDLQLAPTHADRTAGLGFLGESSMAFAPVLLGQGAMVAGVVAGQIFEAGKNLLTFEVQILGFVAFYIVAVLLPLMVFVPHLVRAKRQGLEDFSKLASRYSRGFEGKWFRNDSPPDEEAYGHGRHPVARRLGNSFAIVEDMRVIPIALRDIGLLAITTVLPLLPLLLTAFSLEDLAAKVIKVFF